MFNDHVWKFFDDSKILENTDQIFLFNAKEETPQMHPAIRNIFQRQDKCENLDMRIGKKSLTLLITFHSQSCSTVSSFTNIPESLCENLKSSIHDDNSQNFKFIILKFSSCWKVN